MDKNYKIKNLKGSCLEEIMTGHPSQMPNPFWKCSGLKLVIAHVEGQIRNVVQIRVVEKTLGERVLRCLGHVRMNEERVVNRV